ncbi:ABC transporter ATP-binding protein [Streptomyces sp. ET3-23]|uniref:ABC transporter ATP-binding protein n=1 Tax=Streptomyces sp. ET3-23 TaxID=2885643 RepID=UPI001D0F680D|nr:ABC transporter ATP-binding protein [Streptomyces sp. ET3-23]MCC2279302.1 ABC transporter ATP-binding protein [Streptomyces sp. ET3-23]
MASLALEGVRAGYRGRPALGPVDVALSTGVYALLGRNGAGKTTLMRVMAGILAPLSGRVLIGGTDLAARPEAKDQVAYLGHRAAVSMDLTVRRNLEFWAALHCADPAVRAERLLSARETFDLDPLWERRAGRLSRGQLQRVDLARATLSAPSVLLLDEPLTGLDPVTSAQVRDLIRTWSRTCTVLYSTHNLPEALSIASDVLVLKDGGLSVRNDLIAADTDAYAVRCDGTWPEDVAPSVPLEDGRVRIDVPDGSTIGELVAAAVASGVTVLDIDRISVDADAVLRGILEDHR